MLFLNEQDADSGFELADSLEDYKPPKGQQHQTIEIRASPPPEPANPPAASASLAAHLSRFQQKRPIVYVCAQAGLLALFSVIVLVLLLRTLLPPIDPQDRGRIKIPKDFESLQDLNQILQIYKQRHFGRVLSSFILIYLFLQAYSLPGSMYLSILSGAMYGLWGIPLVCCCVACGASLCYGLSALFGPALLHASAKWRNRLAEWNARIRAQRANLISYLIVLRIAPLPPHWVVNVVAPHLSIDLKSFWISTFAGVFGVTFIHITIGKALSEMSSSDDFHLISVHNFLLLSGIVVAALFPVLIRSYWKNELDDAAKAQSVGAIALDPDAADPFAVVDYNDQPKSQLIFLDDQYRDLPPRETISQSNRRSAELKKARVALSQK